MKTKKPKVQYYRKLGHLWQTAYGTVAQRSFGHGLTKKAATIRAKEHWKEIYP